MLVVDSTTLIVLARIGAFSLLEELFGTIVIPPSVRDDVVTRGRGRPGDPETRAGLAAGWITVQAPARLLPPPHGQMHRGEIEVLSLAAELGAAALIDEGPGRERAIRDGLSCLTTLDVLFLAKDVGRIAAVRPHLDALLAQGFYLDDDIYRRVLEKAGETS